MENAVIDHSSLDANVDHSAMDNQSLGNALALPDWASALVASGSGQWQSANAGLRYRTLSSDHFTLTSIICPQAVQLSERDFANSTVSAYRILDRELRRHDAGYLVRVWNFIPEILAALGELPQRYMVFNAGRHAAYREWNQGEYCFETQVATASGVGHPGTDLVVHGMATACPGIPVENPRQIPSYRYSARYGPVAPCFSRATRVVVAPDQRPWLLVGGTASVRGEVTVFPDDLEGQAEETCRNLEALMVAGLNGHGGNSHGTPRSALDHYRHLRVYYVHAAHRARVADLISRRFQRAEIELVHADLCRKDLLIEIEGVAELPTYSELA